MIKNIYVYPEYYLQDDRFYHEGALISITSPEAERFVDVRKYRKYMCLGFHDLGFRDLQILKEKEYKHFIPFNKKMAQRIWNFVDDLYQDDSIEILTIHCEAGISRSPAVAYAIWLCGYCENKLHSPNCCPNDYVLSIMINEHGKRMRKLKGE